MQLFCDLDGVLADFDGHYERVFGLRPTKEGGQVDWRKMAAHGDFFAGISPLPDAAKLWSRIERHNPIILTGIPGGIVPEAAQNKHDWVRRYVSKEVEVRCCKVRQKYLHAEVGDVLIDDRERYALWWTDVGGIWITHNSAAETIAVLDGMGL